MQLLTFCEDDQLYALELAQIECVIWAAKLTPCKTPSSHFSGILNLHENPILVVSLARLLGGVEKPMKLSDRIIIFHHHDQLFGLWCAGVKDVIIPDSQLSHLNSDIKQNGAPFLKTIISYQNQLIFVCDCEKLSAQNSLPVCG